MSRIYNVAPGLPQTPEAEALSARMAKALDDARHWPPNTPEHRQLMERIATLGGYSTPERAPPAVVQVGVTSPEDYEQSWPQEAARRRAAGMPITLEEAEALKEQNPPQDLPGRIAYEHGRGNFRLLSEGQLKALAREHNTTVSKVAAAEDNFLRERKRQQVDAGQHYSQDLPGRIAYEHLSQVGQAAHARGADRPLPPATLSQLAKDYEVSVAEVKAAEDNYRRQRAEKRKDLKSLQGWVAAETIKEAMASAPPPTPTPRRSRRPRGGRGGGGGALPKISIGR